MTSTTPVPSKKARLVIKVPFTIHRRSGRKCVQVVAPPGNQTNPTAERRRPDPLAIAVARAHRWQELLEAGTYRSVSHLTRALNVDFAYVSRLLQLTLLAPDIIESILNGRELSGLSLTKLGWRLPLSWPEQRTYIQSLNTRRR
jgi:hypothetical protein